MKKLLLFFVCAVPFFSAGAQNIADANVNGQRLKSVQTFIIDAGYKTNADRFLLGIKYRKGFDFLPSLRIAPDAQFVFPKNKFVGLDLNLNVQYLLDFQNGAAFYPLAGLSMENQRYMGNKKKDGEKNAKGFTDWGFNLGAGFDYFIARNTFLNAEGKYIFSKSDCFVFTLGLGYRF